MAASVDAKLLRATKFPPEFNQKVDMQKVNLQVMKKWIASRISEILGSEDDVVIELCFNLIDGPRFPDIKSLQIQLTGFLDKDTAPFCKELWKLCLSAQSSPQGVPKELLEAKKLELIQEKIDADKAAEEARVRRETQERRDRELAEMRDRDRRDRSFRGGRGDNWRGGRRGGDRAFDDRRGFARGTGRGASPPRRDRDSYQGNRDRYVPEGRRGAREDFRRGRSPTRSVSTDSRTSSRSRSLIHRDVGLGIDLLGTGSESDRLAEGTLEVVAITADITHPPPTIILTRMAAVDHALLPAKDVDTPTHQVAQGHQHAKIVAASADLVDQHHERATGDFGAGAQVEAGVEAEAEAEAETETEMLLVPRRTGDTPAPPDPMTTDQLIFPKMKTDPDHHDIKRPRRPRRFVLLDRDFVSGYSPYRELTLCRQTKTLQQKASELKEKLLKDKIMKMRRTSKGDAVER
ncbi:hypothetical protein F5Y09DRAFT_343258 [Xylaria sp. FL1042]|nr:hypothetical protein F5Y09DRAFT_343258 [Xylaria sp. FL1042]